jgi:hypothetical protein
MSHEPAPRAGYTLRNTCANTTTTLGIRRLTAGSYLKLEPPLGGGAGERRMSRRL